MTITQDFQAASSFSLLQYRTVQNFDGENIDEFDEFPAIRQYFPIKIFHLVSYLHNKMNTLAFVNFLLVKLFPTLIRQKFPPSKICAEGRFGQLLRALCTIGIVVEVDWLCWPQWHQVWPCDLWLLVWGETILSEFWGGGIVVGCYVGPLATRDAFRHDVLIRWIALVS